MKTATATAVAPRPLLELLRLPQPEKYPALSEFELEVESAWKQFRKERPLGLRRDELNFDI
jgi:hypothetical protein